MISKQLSNFRIVPQFRNLTSPQDWRDVQNATIDIRYFNAEISYAEWSPIGRTTSQALSGRLRSEVSGFRASVALSWNYSFNSAELQRIANFIPFGFDRLIWSGVATNAYDPDYVILSNGPNVNDYFNGQKVVIKAGAGDEVSFVSDYTGSTGRIDLTVPVGTYAVNDVVELYAVPDQRIRFLFYPDATKSDNFEITFESVNLQALIEATIVRQPIRLNAQSTAIINAIPNFAILS
jgi:hypothetical protein